MPPGAAERCGVDRQPGPVRRCSRSAGSSTSGMSPSTGRSSTDPGCGHPARPSPGRPRDLSPRPRPTAGARRDCAAPVDLVPRRQTAGEPVAGRGRSVGEASHDPGPQARLVAEHHERAVEAARQAASACTPTCSDDARPRSGVRIDDPELAVPVDGPFDVGRAVAEHHDVATGRAMRTAARTCSSSGSSVEVGQQLGARLRRRTGCRHPLQGRRRERTERVVAHGRTLHVRAKWW